MDKKFFLLASALFVPLVLKDTTVKNTTIGLKTYKANRNKGKKAALIAVQKKLGFVPLSVLIAIAKPVTSAELLQAKNKVKEVYQKHGTAAARAFERIMRSETSHFKSLLFLATRSAGAILGNDFCLYIITRNGRNLIAEKKQKQGKRFCYKGYNSFNEALDDLERLLKKHSFDPVRYSGGTVSNSYWGKIQTPFLNEILKGSQSGEEW
jgi:hypothetical protein